MAIAFGAVTTGDADGLSTNTFSSPSVAGSDTLGVVTIFMQTNVTVTGVTWNGSNCTFIGRADKVGGGAERVEMWYILNPTSGVTNVVATRSGSSNAFFCRAAYYTGVRQSSQPDSSVSLRQASGTTLTLTTTTIADNCWTVSTARNGTGAFTASTNTTFRSGNNQFLADNNASITPAGSYSMSVTLSNVESFGVMASFAPASPATTIKTWDDIARANVKTLNGVSSASIKTINGIT